jgi:hypothetical protein
VPRNCPSPLRRRWRFPFADSRTRSSAGGSGPVWKSDSDQRTCGPWQSRTQRLTSPFAPVSIWFLVFLIPWLKADTSTLRCPNRRMRCQLWNLSGATGGTQTYSRQPKSKLGRLPCARQGLVQILESNTKYGGKRGKPRAESGLGCLQVSVSAHGFRNEKVSDVAPPTNFARCSQGSYLLHARDCLWRDSLRVAESGR